MVGYALGVLTVALFMSAAAAAGEHAERDRRIRLAVLRSRSVR